jgi:hypothetical protein
MFSFAFRFPRRELSNIYDSPTEARQEHRLPDGFLRACSAAFVSSKLLFSALLIVFAISAAEESEASCEVTSNQTDFSGDACAALIAFVGAQSCGNH